MPTKVGTQGLPRDEPCSGTCYAGEYDNCCKGLPAAGITS